MTGLRVYTSAENKRGPGHEGSPLLIHAPPPTVAEIEVPNPELLFLDPGPVAQYSKRPTLQRRNGTMKMKNLAFAAILCAVLLGSEALALNVPIGSTLTAGDTLFVRFHLVSVSDPFNTFRASLRVSENMTGQSMTVTLYDVALQPVSSETFDVFGLGMSWDFVEPPVDLSSIRDGLPGMVSFTLNSGTDIAVSNVVLLAGFIGPGGGFLSPIGGTFTFAINQVPPAPGPLPPGPLMITENTKLTADLFGSIVIDADGVSLNCDGHSITGVQDGAGILLDGRTGVKIKNCVVSGFFYGFRLRNSDWNRLMENTADNNVFGGFVVDNSNGNSLVANAATSNAQAFLLQNSSSNEVKMNVATGNGSGFLVDTGAVENIVKANEATGNRRGFVIDDAFDNTLKDNAATGNTQYGFLISEASDNLLKGNHACNNLVLDALQQEGTNTFKDNDFCTTSGI
jgi:parallel beta-helix repeat protein